jgi:Flp pilus assembly protein TadD
MADLDAPFVMAKPIRGRGLLAALTASLLLGGCAQVGGGESDGLFAALAPAALQAPAEPAAPMEPQQAAEHWSKQYAKNPRDLDAALSYAQSLKALGKKREALAVLQQASLIHGSDRRLAGDYGRLALDLDQVSVAKKVLEIADDPANPDWRIILARGTALAKEGRYREAIAFYERAQALNAGHPSVLNNLALAYTMSGEPERGEQLLRQAAASGNDSAKVRQNLALVLGLQGKYDEATKIASVDLAPGDAQANTALLRKMVKLDGKTMPQQDPAEATWAPAVATAEAPARSKAAVAKPVQAAPVHAASTQAPALRATKFETGFGTQSDSAHAASLWSTE